MATPIGLVSIGQLPRPDTLIEEMSQILGNGYELVVRGALDDLSRIEIEDQLTPCPGDYILTTLLRDGRSVLLDKKRLLPLIQRRIDELNERNVEAIILACVGTFPHFHSTRPVLVPRAVLTNVVKGVAQDVRVGTVVALPEQIEQERLKWQEVGLDVIMTHADPFGNQGLLERAAEELTRQRVDLVVLECFGHTLAMQEAMREMTGKPVMLVRSVLARVASLFV